jgi:hypothetical protein
VDPPIEIVASDVYLGLSMISALLFTIALVSPLTWWVGLLVLAVGMGLLALSSFQGLRMPSAKWLLRCLLLLLPLALFVSTRDITFYDTGLYHQQAIKWLSNFGLVRGLALLHFRFGLTSSWFAIAAPINNGPLAGRAAAIIGGLLFAFLSVVATSIAIRLSRAGSLSMRTTTWLIFCIGLLAVLLTWNLETSLSPDLAIWLLPIVTATILADESLSEADRVGKACVVAMLGALMKLNSVAVIGYCLVVAGVHFIRGRPSRTILCAWLAITASLGLILCWINLRVSGCPAFPGPFLCISANWSVGAKSAAKLVDFIKWYDTFGGPPRTEWWPLLISAALASIVSFRRHRRDSFVRHALGVSWAGIILIRTQAPVTRYAIGYLLLPIAIAGASVAKEEFAGRLANFGGRLSRLAVPCGVAAWLIICAIAVGHLKDHGELLYPRRMASSTGDPIHIVNRATQKDTQLVLWRERHSGLDAWRPATSDQCWDASLPCTPESTLGAIDLLDRGLGLSGGFQKR